MEHRVQLRQLDQVVWLFDADSIRKKTKIGFNRFPLIAHRYEGLYLFSDL